MRRIASLALFTAVVLIGGAAFYWAGIGRSLGGGAPASPVAEEALSVVPGELAYLKTTNPVALETRYGGRLLELAGTVRQIEGSAAGPVLVVEGGRVSLGVACELGAGDAPRVAELSAGAPVKVRGRIAPTIRLTPLLRPCSLVP